MGSLMPEGRDSRNKEHLFSRLRSKIYLLQEVPVHERVGIIGAGPAGLAAAYSLGKLGIPVDVFEAGSMVGGMAKTIDLWGQKVDLGPHRFFSADARVNRLWLEIAGTDYRMIERQTRIFYNGQFFNYPLQLADSLAKLGSVEAIGCLISFLCQKLRRDHVASNFEEWVCGRFGRRLYEIFFRGYSEKLWGIPCTQLNADFADQRIRKLSLYKAVHNALTHGRGNRHPTLVGRFAYPIGGTGSIYSKMAHAIRSQNGAVNLHAPVRRVVPKTEGVMELELVSGERRAYRHIVSTMPLTLLINSLPDVPQTVLDACAGLHFRNTIVVYFRIEAKNLFPDQWIYIHAPELAVGRITNFRNWIPELYGDNRETILSLELWCDPEDAQWNRPDTYYIEQAKQDLFKTGLIQDAGIAEAYVVKIPFCYPVYSLGYRNSLNILQDYLQTIPSLDVIGRCGSFKYNNQDHSLLMGILVAEKIALARNHDLWGVNADDAYQESAIITETGLAHKSS
jgi:protoporphyrinogen oxidase